MDYKQIAKDVQLAMNDYLRLIELNDIQGMAEMKMRLKAQKIILLEAYQEAARQYLRKKERCEHKRLLEYQEKRRLGDSQVDSTNYSKLMITEDVKERDNLRIRKEKMRPFLKNIDDVIIDIAVALKEYKNEITYG